MRVPFALMILCALTQSVLAQGTEECRSIPDRMARLACYDREAPPLTSRTPASPSARAAPAPRPDSQNTWIRPARMMNLSMRA